GSLWLGSSDNGLYRLYGGRVDHFGAADGLSSNTVISLFEDREGNLWVATSKGLDFFRDSRVITLSASEGLSSDHAGSVLATDDGTVWIGNRGYLDAFRGGQITSVRIPGKRVTALLQDHARRLWVGIDNMLTFYEQGQFHKVNRPDGSPLGTTTAMAEDREQNIWAVANPDRKLFRIRDRRVQEEFDESRIPIARAVAAHPSGGVWLGFLDSFGHYRNGKLDVIRTNGGPRLAVESNGSVWAATRGGLVRWKDGRAETLTSKNGLPCDLIYNVIHDDHARLWLYAKCGLIGIADTELERWWRQPGIVIQAQLLDALDGAMPGSNTFHPGVTKSPDGRLWFVHEAVVQMFDPNRVSQTGSAPPVYVEQVRADRKDYGNNGPFRLPPRTRDLEISYTALSYSIPEKVRFRYKLDGRDREWQEVGSRRQAFYSDLPPGEYAFHVTASNGDGVWNESGGRIEFSVAPAYYQTTWFRALCAAVLIVFVGAAYRFRLWQVQRESGKLRDVIETVPAYAWSALPDGSVDFVNRRWQEFSGVSLDQTLNWGWEEAIHPEDLGRFVEAWHAAVASGSTMEAEARVRRADGQYRWLLIRSVPLRDKTGKIVKWYGVSTDIDDRKRAEQALRRSEAYLAETQRLTHTGTYAADYTTAPLYWSEEMFRIFGFDPEDGLPTRDQPLKRVHPEDLEKFEQAWNRVITRKIDANVEYRIVLPGGTVKHAYGLGHPVLNADGELIEIVGTTVDITERKRAEEERERLRQLEADLAHINRVSMMGELAASIAHEVNQPLSGIVSNGGACLRWLAQDPPEVEEVREAVRDIVRDGKRAGEVIARIRALTRRTAPPPKEKLDLNASIRGVLAIVADEAKRTGVAVRTRFADDLFCVYGDHVQMQQVVLNLVMNAIEAMNGLAGRARQLVITTRNLDPDQACVTVEDSGVGMDRDTMAKIFEPFY
ncbi:MAG: PAS domain-containing protein, partial [Bryobacterales bacterium]|nr:PAS domain-containing protein [Bryobacterales bacterium]